MRATPMTKRCVHCHRSYPYDPSRGDLGNFCKLCGRAQIRSLPTAKPKDLPSSTPKFPTPWKLF